MFAKIFVFVKNYCKYVCVLDSVAKPHRFYAAPAPGENFDLAPAAPAPTLLHI
jgi:hypothetical protein